MRLREILPITEWLGSYSLKRLGPDGVAGLSLAAFVIPESLAYASLAGLPPVSGLYCYLAAGLAYALFGTSRQLAVGPTSALALAVAAGIATLDAGDPARAAALAAAIALMVGVIAIGGRFLGLANLAYFFSNSVLTGFKTGAALYIASTQLPKLLGLEGGGGNFFARLLHVGTLLPEASLPSVRHRRAGDRAFPPAGAGLARTADHSDRRRCRDRGNRRLRLGQVRCQARRRPAAGPAGLWPPPGVAGRPEGLGAHGLCLLPARLQRGHIGCPQLRPEARLRDRPGAGTHRPRRVQRRRVACSRLSGIGRHVANGGERHERRHVRRSRSS